VALPLENLISVTFSLAQGNFEGGGNTATVSGLRVTCHITNAGGAAQSNMELAVYGLPLSMMNQLTTFGKQYSLQTTNQSGVMVQAGNANGMSLVFIGNIFQAWIDAQSQPHVSLRVVARPGSFYSAKPQTPLSFSGATQISTVASQIAGLLGAQFQNNGVTGTLNNPYYASDAISMIRSLAEHAGISWVLENNVLSITPKGQARPSSVPLISPQTGMKGYPVFAANTIVVRTLFNPNIIYLGNIQIQSSLTPANGTWNVFLVEQELESKVPHGKWDTIASCIVPDQQIPTS
jgi:hypothetical protein